MIVLASDHSGLELKNRIKKVMTDYNLKVLDVGPYEYERDDDYPDYVFKANQYVLQGYIGIYFCASGIGVSMAANHCLGVRAVNATNKEQAFWARHHEDANVLCIGQNFVSFEDAMCIINVFLKENFDGGRHLRRINKYSKNS